MPADSNRDIGAGADGDPDVGLRQGRRVVDSVSDHRHADTAGLEALDGVGLVGRQHLGGDLVDPDAPRHRVGDRLRVAGDHRHPQAHVRAAGCTASADSGRISSSSATAPRTPIRPGDESTVRPSPVQLCAGLGDLRRHVSRRLGDQPRAADA